MFTPKTFNGFHYCCSADVIFCASSIESKFILSRNLEIVIFILWVLLSFATLRNKCRLSIRSFKYVTHFILYSHVYLNVKCVWFKMKLEKENFKVPRKRFMILLFSFASTTVLFGYNFGINHSDNETLSSYHFHAKEQVITCSFFIV